MKCLWLTRKYPRPANSGELIYSDGLLRALAVTGVEITAIAHDNEELPVGDGSRSSRFTDPEGIQWRLGLPRLCSRLGSLLTRYPSDSWRLRNGGPLALVREALASESWDQIVFDHAAMGWALGPVQRRIAKMPAGSRPKLVYVSHNHEAKIRREIALQSGGGPLARMVYCWDAEKYARQEEMLCRSCDLVTAITETEVSAYRASYPHQRYLCLTPGFNGRGNQGRVMDASTPRRVVMTGSFEWIAKRINLERFLEKAAAPFSEAGIELQIVGKTEESFRESMLARFPGVDFVGRVPSMDPYLDGARMGLIVEEFGGGFKLKALDYVFHSLPLAGLDHAVDGLPLRSPDQVLLAKDTPSLINGVIQLIDNFPKLNQMQQDSLAICQQAFRWEDRGAALAQALRVGR